MLFHAHSGIRYLVLLAGLAAVVYAAWGLLARRPYGKGMRVLAAVFAGLLDLNVLLGFALLLSRPFHTQLVGHLATMVLAAVAAHVVPFAMRRRPVAERGYAPYLVSSLVALALVLVGVMAIGRPVLGF